MIRRTATLLASFTLLSLVVTTAPAQAQVPILDDYGDAPVSYGEAAHGVLDPEIPLWMGDIVLGFDPDGGNQPSPGADADDCNGPLGAIVPAPVSCLPAPLSGINDLLSDGENFILDDEDGVDIGQLVPGQVTPVSVEATAPGLLNAWIDWAGDGTFNNTIDRIFTNRPLDAGPNALQFTVPAISIAQATYARFRLSSAALSGPTGVTNNGEVEDYQVFINQDFGDAPDTYGTLDGSGGPRHALTGAPVLGAIVDSEANGIPSAFAIGDDANPVGGPDDEDGVTFGSALQQNASTAVRVTVSTAARLDAFVDFNRNGVFTDAGEKVFDNVALTAGDNNLLIATPVGASVGGSFSRWRVSSAGGLGAGGAAANGEVEDHAITIVAQPRFDFGDAPSTFPTTLAANGARHGVGPLLLGDRIDDETDGQPTAAADGDDLNGGLDDEDGVDLGDTVLVPGKATTVEVRASGTAFLDAWLDTDRDGNWDDSEEHVIDSEIVNACGDLDNAGTCTGWQTVDFTVPPGHDLGLTYMRFRLSSGGVNAPDGFTPDGEVEDYRVTLTLECGAVIAGSFTLPFNLNCPGNGDDINGLFVGADRTTIDLDGHTISGLEPAAGDSVGIGLWEEIDGANDVTILDGAIQGFDVGVDLVGDRLRLTNVDISGSVGNTAGGDGLVVEGIDTLFEDGSILDNRNGITNDGHGVTVRNSDVSQNREAGIVSQGANIVIETTTVTENGDDGVRSQGQNGTVRDSTVSRNTGSGVIIDGTNGLVTNSTIEDNGGDGAFLDGDRGRVNENPSISGNGGDGIRMIGNLDNVQVLRNARVSDNGADGIHVLSGRKIFVKLNVAKGNGDDGIDIEKNARGRVNVNTMGRSNHDFAIEAHDRVTGTKNKGNPCRPAKLCSDA
ncbi:MAG: GEVED domain-containing protein [Actinomycetota bacterium]